MRHIEANNHGISAHKVCTVDEHGDGCINAPADNLRPGRWETTVNSLPIMQESDGASTKFDPDTCTLVDRFVRNLGCGRRGDASDGQVCINVVGDHHLCGAEDTTKHANSVAKLHKPVSAPQARQCAGKPSCLHSLDRRGCPRG